MELWILLGFFVCFSNETQAWIWGTSLNYAWEFSNLQSVTGLVYSTSKFPREQLLVFKTQTIPRGGFEVLNTACFIVVGLLVTRYAGVAQARGLYPTQLSAVCTSLHHTTRLYLHWFLQSPRNSLEGCSFGNPAHRADPFYSSWKPGHLSSSCDFRHCFHFNFSSLSLIVSRPLLLGCHPFLLRLCVLLSFIYGELPRSLGIA